jgi:hypothetical protein
MPQAAKALTVLALALLNYLLDKAGVEELHGDQVETIIGEIVTAALVWGVPNGAGVRRAR